jgi:hypothetical protein
MMLHQNRLLQLSGNKKQNALQPLYYKGCKALNLLKAATLADIPGIILARGLQDSIWFTYVINLLKQNKKERSLIRER